MSKSVSFIGYGKLGSVLSSFLTQRCYLMWIMDSNEEAGNKAESTFSGVKVYSAINEIIDVPDYIFLTVEDSVIEKIAIKLAEHLNKKLKGCLVIHCSGALPVSLLNSCKDNGADIAVIHPYQTFYYPSEDLFDSIGWSIRSDNRSRELEELIISIGGVPIVLPDDDKITSLYHCSAVVSSNFLNTLLSTSEEIAQLSGIPAEKFIPQIVKTTIENNLRTDSKEFPITGPYARADVRTIINHIKALKPYPHLLKSYCYFALATIEKLKHEKLADERILNEMEKLLKKNLDEK